MADNVNAEGIESGKLVVLKQLPVIEEHMQLIKADVTKRVQEALSLACTEETYQYVKKERAALNREHTEMEQKRKQIKQKILEPYKAFEDVYKDCAGDIYDDADRKLKARITEVEDGLREQKTAELRTYFDEYRESLGLDAELAGFERAGIRVTLSASLKSLRDEAKTWLDRISADLRLINSQNCADEIFVEYRKSLNASDAILKVNERHAAIEAENRRRKEMAEQAEARRKAAEEVRKLAEAARETEIPAAVSAPETVHAPTAETAPATYRLSFTVYGTKEQLTELKHFLINGGYKFE